MKLKLFTTIAACVMAASAAHANLIINGDFETGDFTGWSVPSDSLNPWTPVSDNSFSGSFSAYNPELGYAEVVVALYQSFTPTPVENIAAAGFYYYDSPGASPGTVGLATLLLFSDGTSIQDTLFAADPSYQVNSWAFRDLTPTLNSYPGKELVAIGFYAKAGDSLNIDDVFIITVPESPDNQDQCRPKEKTHDRHGVKSPRTQPHQPDGLGQSHHRHQRGMSH